MKNVLLFQISQLNRSDSISRNVQSNLPITNISGKKSNRLILPSLNNKVGSKTQPVNKSRLSNLTTKVTPDLQQPLTKNNRSISHNNQHLSPKTTSEKILIQITF